MKLIPKNVAKFLALALFALFALGAHAADPVLQASAGGYTIIGAGSYADIRCYGICGPGSNAQVMPVVEINTPAQVSAIGSQVQGFNAPAGDPYTVGATIAGGAIANPGAVHVYAQNGAIAATASVNDSDGVPYLPSGASVIANVYAGASFSDTLHVGGNLPIGTPTSFYVNYYLEGAYESEINRDGTPSMAWSASWLNPAGSGYTGFTTCGEPSFLGCATDDNVPYPNLRLLVPVLVNAKAGDDIAISTSLSVGGTAILDASTYFGTCYANCVRNGYAGFANTAGEWVSQIPDGVQITSASGFDYTVDPSTVPVPSAAWLAGSGLFGLAGLARKRKAA